ncbi:GIY-YIG nuclease family protein [Xanthobacter sp. V3C-3]|uniref:GIY-YIG nuclease family protein n=1 Tax=Xanthobacter lutulentifluminis TaxID=3119935 RepID=UPI0037267515
MTDLSKLNAYLYVCGYEGGPFKIGYAYNPDKRMKDHVRDGHAAIFMVGKWPAGAAIVQAAERYVHWILRDKHLQKEWFNVTQEEAEAAVRQALSPGALKAHDEFSMIPPVTGRDKNLGHKEWARTNFAAGTLIRIKSVIANGETQSDFMRAAVEAELKRRERQKPDRPE